jgi:hypothetical protein
LVPPDWPDFERVVGTRFEQRQQFFLARRQMTRQAFEAAFSNARKLALNIFDDSAVMIKFRTRRWLMPATFYAALGWLRKFNAEKEQ